MQSVKVGRVWEAALSISARLPVKVHCVTSMSVCVPSTSRCAFVSPEKRQFRIVAPRPLPRYMFALALSEKSQFSMVVSCES